MTEDKPKKKRYYQENQEACQKYSRKYYAKNRDAILTRAKKRYQENKEAYQEYNRKYYTENRDAILTRTKKRYQENPERYKAHLNYHREYYAKNRAKIRSAQNASRFPTQLAKARARVKELEEKIKAKNPD